MSRKGPCFFNVLDGVPDVLYIQNVDVIKVASFSTKDECTAKCNGSSTVSYCKWTESKGHVSPGQRPGFGLCCTEVMGKPAGDVWVLLSVLHSFHPPNHPHLQASAGTKIAAQAEEIKDRTQELLHKEVAINEGYRKMISMEDNLEDPGPFPPPLGLSCLQDGLESQKMMYVTFAYRQVR